MAGDKNRLYGPNDYEKERKDREKRQGQQQFARFSAATPAALTSVINAPKAPAYQVATKGYVGAPFFDNGPAAVTGDVEVDLSAAGSQYSIYTIAADRTFSFAGLPVGYSKEFSLEIRNSDTADPHTATLTGVTGLDSIEVPAGSTVSLKFVAAHREGDTDPVITHVGSTAVPLNFPIRYPGATAAAAAATTLSWAGNTGNARTVTLGRNTTLAFSDPPPAGAYQELTVLFVQDSTGDRTVSGPSALKNSNNLNSQIDKAAGAKTLIKFSTMDGGTTYFAEKLDLSVASGAQTPWEQDIDADGYNLGDFGALSFRPSTAVPSDLPAISSTTLTPTLTSLDMRIPANGLFRIIAGNVIVSARADIIQLPEQIFLSRPNVSHSLFSTFSWGLYVESSSGTPRTGLNFTGSHTSLAGIKSTGSGSSRALREFGTIKFQADSSSSGNEEGSMLFDVMEDGNATTYLELDGPDKIIHMKRPVWLLDVTAAPPAATKALYAMNGMGIFANVPTTEFFNFRFNGTTDFRVSSGAVSTVNDYRITDATFATTYSQLEGDASATTLLSSSGIIALSSSTSTFPARVFVYSPPSSIGTEATLTFRAGTNSAFASGQARIQMRTTSSSTSNFSGLLELSVARNSAQTPFLTLDGSTNLITATRDIAAPAIRTGSVEDTLGNLALDISATASAARRLNVKAATSAGTPELTVSGTGDNIGLAIKPKGTGTVTITNLALSGDLTVEGLTATGVSNLQGAVTIGTADAAADLTATGDVNVGTDLTVSGSTSVQNLTIGGRTSGISFNTGGTVQGSALRIDSWGTNGLYYNVPTGDFHAFSVNGRDSTRIYANGDLRLINPTATQGQKADIGFWFGTSGYTEYARIEGFNADTAPPTSRDGRMKLAVRHDNALKTYIDIDGVNDRVTLTNFALSGDLTVDDLTVEGDATFEDDVDMDGNDIEDAQSISFEDSIPNTTDTKIGILGGNLTYFVPGGSSHAFRVAGVEKFKIGGSQIDVEANIDMQNYHVVNELILRSEDASPDLEITRNALPPPAAQRIGEINFNAQNSAGDIHRYAAIYAGASLTTEGSEDGWLQLGVYRNGALVPVVEAGVVIASGAPRSALGFFGATPHEKRTGIATLSQVISALEDYGLIN